MKVVNIGMTIPFVGGFEKHIFNLCTWLAKKNNVILLTQRAKRKPTKFKIVEVPYFDGNVYLRNFSFYVFCIPHLIKLIIFDKPDIIHIHFNIFSGLLGLISRLFGLKLIYTVHGFSGWKISRLFILRFLVKFFLNHSNLIVCISPKVLNDLIELGVKRKITYIPNAIESKYFSSKRRKIKKYILFFGRLHKQKGVNYLIEAYKKLYKEGETKGYKLIIIGDGPEKNRLIELSEGIKDIIFTGYLSEEKLIKYINSAYLIVLPSLYEGFPIALLEAMASGRPVITANIKEITSVLKRGVIFF